LYFLEYKNKAVGNNYILQFTKKIIAAILILLEFSFCSKVKKTGSFYLDFLKDLT